MVEWSEAVLIEGVLLSWLSPHSHTSSNYSYSTLTLTLRVVLLLYGVG